MHPSRGDRPRRSIPWARGHSDGTPRARVRARWRSGGVQCRGPPHPAIAVFGGHPIAMSRRPWWVGGHGGRRWEGTAGPRPRWALRSSDGRLAGLSLGPTRGGRRRKRGRQRQRGPAASSGLQRRSPHPAAGRGRPRKSYPPRGSSRDGLDGSASRVLVVRIRLRRSGELQTSSFFAPIRVRSRSANSAASNGFLNVSLMLERSKLVELPSSGNSAMRITSANSLLRRRF